MGNTVDEKGIVRNQEGEVIHSYPSNSNKTKEREAQLEKEEKAVKKVISGEVITKKRPLRGVKEDIMEGLGEIASNTLIPTAKNMIADFFRNLVDVLLWGRQGGSNNYYWNNGRPSSVSYQPYNTMYNNYNNRSGRDSRPRILGYNYEDCIVPNRPDAEIVIDNLQDSIEKYGVASVAELYQLCGKEIYYTDNNYGWEDLRNVQIRPVKEGYLIQMPPVIELRR